MSIEENGAPISPRAEACTGPNPRESKHSKTSSMDGSSASPLAGVSSPVAFFLCHSVPTIAAPWSAVKSLC